MQKQLASECKVNGAFSTHNADSDCCLDIRQRYRFTPSGHQLSVTDCPAEQYGNVGTTQTFRLTAGEDELVHTFDWYSWSIHLVCNASDSKRPTGVAVVSTGPWARGHTASDDVLAIAFHFNGKTVRKYSTLDVAGKPDNVSQSVSHYTVIEEVLGFRWILANEYVFEVRTVDGRLLAFDPITGDRLDEFE